MIVEFENKCAKYRRDAILTAIQVACTELMPRVRKLNINIQTMKSLCKQDNIYGDCMWEEDRDFTIRVDVSVPLDVMVTTVLHEMVHVKQYVYKQHMDYSLPYYDRPHEIEAHGLEKQLKEKWDAKHQ